ncbi:helix-turn-helix domain-containing protein [Maribellus maritimus]|uniref:helix-turn-helix domain-containing protein n=1 Tax=Maribellus maritimus TaxID=2870838 RepID=UPI001EE9E085|nr:helix-turn-helix transcriptional regulator [Maribellus maritimus]MCG6191428.1 helix-turn-helix domain-containing protein [Maribellus maritimus]
MNQPELGKKINEIRNQKGITQKDLSEKCNIDIRTIQRIESGEVFPRASTIKLIADAFELDSYELNGNEISISENFRILLLVTMIAGIIYLINWFFYAPLFIKDVIYYSYNWISSIVNAITVVFFYYGFYLVGKYLENKLLAFASFFFMIGSTVYFIITTVIGVLNISAGDTINQLVISILGINCILFGFGLLNTKSSLTALYKSTGIMALLTAPFFITPIETLNIVGCWMNIPLYILMIFIIYLEYQKLCKYNYKK